MDLSQSGARTFPPTYFRGIRKKNQVFEYEGVEYPRGEAFEPDLRTKAARQDDWMETSIHWNDDDDALPLVLDEPHFYRVARMPRSELDELPARYPIAVNSLKYERRPLEDNPYHGNILFRIELRQARNMITNAIAMSCLELISR